MFDSPRSRGAIPGRAYVPDVLVQALGVGTSGEVALVRSAAAAAKRESDRCGRGTGSTCRVPSSAILSRMRSRITALSASRPRRPVPVGAQSPGVPRLTSGPSSTRSVGEALDVADDRSAWPASVQPSGAIDPGMPAVVLASPARHRHCRACRPTASCGRGGVAPGVLAPLLA